MVHVTSNMLHVAYHFYSKYESYAEMKAVSRIFWSRKDKKALEMLRWQLFISSSALQQLKLKKTKSFFDTLDVCLTIVVILCGNTHSSPVKPEGRIPNDAVKS